MKKLLFILLLVSSVARAQTYCCNYTPPAATFDSDASSYLTAIGISNDGTHYFTSTPQEIRGDSIWMCVNRAFVKLKSFSLYSKLNAWWPFIGGTSTANKYNAVDPRDLDAAFRLTFNGTWTHSETGAHPGSNGYAETHMAGTTVSISSNHISVYSTTNVTGGSGMTDAIDVGYFNAINQRLWLAAGYPSLSNLPSFANASTAYSGGSANAKGYFIVSKTGSTTADLYKDNSNIFSSSSTDGTGSTASTTYYIGALNFQGSPYPFSYTERSYATITIGSGLTSTDVTNLTSIIEELQTSLHRNN